MVAGLKQGNRVKGPALKVFGHQKAKELFPTNWKTHIVCGVVMKKGDGRKMVVKWDSIGETSSVSSRLLDHEETSTNTPATASTVLQAIKVHSSSDAADSRSLSSRRA